MLEGDLAQVESFTIPSDKITRYLLDRSHPRGQAKAAFFMAFGFDPTRPQELVEALFKHILASDSMVTTSPHPFGYGSNLKVVGPMKSPNGGSPLVQAVWLVNRGGNVATFVTAYPARPRGSHT